MHQPQGFQQKRRDVRGAVLVIGLIMLAVVSVLALFSVRNAVSTEAISANVRTTELATQAAEIALRHCELSVAEVMAQQSGESPSYPTTFTAANVAPLARAEDWQDITQWDVARDLVFVVPLDMINQGDLRTTFKRAPECMVAPVLVVSEGSAFSNESSAFIVTARGFGPEVAVGTGRPTGTEVWLQSHIEL
jgi:Tfp pilus assembly protein PilX